jgi:hypothetical protein
MGAESPIEGLTDEQVLKEFVKRFKPDGAMLMYFDSDVTYGFTRWRNKKGREWEKRVVNALELIGFQRGLHKEPNPARSVATKFNR